jgi:hypothetical protein
MLVLMSASSVQEHGRLWQLKDRHRDALIRAGLTRWHIGEIASRIGQIYYEYYSRTSETRFLREACVWYDTIRKRQYFKQGEPTSVEVLKQLRYYMRFALICILLDDISKVRGAPPLNVEELEIQWRSPGPTGYGSG